MFYSVGARAIKLPMNTRLLDLNLLSEFSLGWQIRTCYRRLHQIWWLPKFGRPMQFQSRILPKAIAWQRNCTTTHPDLLNFNPTCPVCFMHKWDCMHWCMYVCMYVWIYAYMYVVIEAFICNLLNTSQKRCSSKLQIKKTVRIVIYSWERHSVRRNVSCRTDHHRSLPVICNSGFSWRTRSRRNILKPSARKRKIS